MDLQPLDLNALVLAGGPRLEAALPTHARIECDLAEGLPCVRADREQVQQILLNLLLNGAEALDGQPGCLRIASGRITATRTHLERCRLGSDLPPGDYVLLEVHDPGHGMNEETLARIFDPFFTTKFTGRGLGLSAVLGIVRSHGGALGVESTPGVGSTFRVYLPTLKEGVPREPARASAAEWKSSGRVLIIDDDDAVRLVASAALRMFGFEVEEAVDGVEGLEKVIAAGAARRFILLDLTMPRLDGRGVLEGVRARFPELPVALVSGYSADRVQDLLALGGPTIFIPKPFTLDDLATRLSALIGEAC